MWVSCVYGVYLRLLQSSKYMFVCVYVYVPCSNFWGMCVLLQELE